MHQRWDFDQIREDNLVTTDNYDDYSFTNTIERLIEQEQFTLNSEVLDVEIQDLTNRLATLTSPITGIVTQIDTPIAGVNVTITDKFQIVDPSSLYFEVEIDESDVASIVASQSAQITLEAFTNDPINSQILSIDFASSLSDSGSTVFKAKLSLSSPDALKFRLGMTGDATINLQQKTNVLTVPLEALQGNNGKTIVKVLENNQPVEKEVELGLETDTEIEILSGLKQGDLVIIGEEE